MSSGSRWQPEEKASVVQRQQKFIFNLVGIIIADKPTVFYLSFVMGLFAPKPYSTVRVLVIEDDPDDRRLLMRQLRKSKIDELVKFIEDGKEAFDFLSTLPPAEPFHDLIAIFLDLKLPSMSGLELLRRIKKIPRLQNIPVIVMTASLDPKDFEECHQLKVTAYISKPVTFDSFAKAITSLHQLAS